MTVRLFIEKKPPFYLSSRWDQWELMDDLDNRLMLRQKLPVEIGVQHVLQRMADGWTGGHRQVEINCGTFYGQPFRVFVEYLPKGQRTLFKGKINDRMVACVELPDYVLIERQINNAT